jgi:hypothetical protein
MVLAAISVGTPAVLHGILKKYLLVQVNGETGITEILYWVLIM